jgi:hypothetical protein
MMPEVMRVYVTHDDGTEGRYDVTAVRVTVPVAVNVEYGQIVLTAESAASDEERAS